VSNLRPDQQLLELLRKGDLHGLRNLLVTMLEKQPNDPALLARLRQVEGLLAQQQQQQQQPSQPAAASVAAQVQRTSQQPASTPAAPAATSTPPAAKARSAQSMSQLQAQIMAQPLQYAHAYLQAGRLAESLQLLRIELARNPSNRQVRDLALSVARRIQDMANGGRGPEVGRRAEPVARHDDARARAAAEEAHRARGRGEEPHADWSGGSRPGTGGDSPSYRARAVDEARARLELEQRKLAEAQARVEENRRAEEARKVDEARKAEEAKKREEARLAEETRARAAEEARVAEEAKKRAAEEARLAEEARAREAKLVAEGKVRAADEARVAEEKGAREAAAREAAVEAEKAAAQALAEKKEADDVNRAALLGDATGDAEDEVVRAQVARAEQAAASFGRTQAIAVKSKSGQGDPILFLETLLQRVHTRRRSDRRP